MCMKEGNLMVVCVSVKLVCHQLVAIGLMERHNSPVFLPRAPTAIQRTVSRPKCRDSSVRSAHQPQ